jgi:hypothetical protein
MMCQDGAPRTVICRRIAAGYRDLAAQSALPQFRQAFDELAAQYAAIAADLDTAEKADAASDDKHDGAHRT